MRWLTHEGRTAGGQAGFSYVELVLVVGLMALALLISAAAWQSAMARSRPMQAARLVQNAILEARMLAVYRSLHHFVVLDPQQRSVTIVQDTAAPFGVLSEEDRRLKSFSWPAAIEIRMPPGSVDNPLLAGAETLTAAWSLPEPDGSGWGERLGMTATPEGALQSAEGTPEVIRSGVIVLSDSRGHAASVGIRGQFGAVDWFRWDAGTWVRG